MEKDSFVKDINVEFPLFGKKIEIRLYNSNPLLVEHVIFVFFSKAIELDYIFDFCDNKCVPYLILKESLEYQSIYL